MRRLGGGWLALLNGLALGFVDHTKGGPAKVSVISSGLMGTISGSGVANVLTTGQFTIPPMKKFGYSGAFAGAVEATSSMGGQIMPPAMGAAAFIMADLTPPVALAAFAAASIAKESAMRIGWKAVLSIMRCGAAAIGFLFAPLNMIERIFAAAAGAAPAPLAPHRRAGALHRGSLPAACGSSARDGQ